MRTAYRSTVINSPSSNVKQIILIIMCETTPSPSKITFSVEFLIRKKKKPPKNKQFSDSISSIDLFFVAKKTTGLSLVLPLLAPEIIQPLSCVQKPDLCRLTTVL